MSSALTRWGLPAAAVIGGALLVLLSGFCGGANQNGFMSMRKNLNLDASRQACW